MLKTLKRNYVVTDFSAANWDEINLLITVADTSAATFNYDLQAMRSSFLASEVNGACIVDGHIAVARASYPNITQPQLLLFPLEKNCQWGNAEEVQVDYIVAVILPDDHEATALDNLTVKIHDQFSRNQVTVADTKQLEKIMTKIA